LKFQGIIFGIDLAIGIADILKLGRIGVLSESIVWSDDAKNDRNGSILHLLLLDSLLEVRISDTTYTDRLGEYVRIPNHELGNGLIAESL